MSWTTTKKKTYQWLRLTKLYLFEIKFFLSPMPSLAC